jgi:high-affinity Fe2+/Pb2+ permease
MKAGARAPGGNAMPNLGSPEMMGQLMQYLPMLMRVAAKLPGLIVGYVCAWAFVLLFAGASGMKAWTDSSFGPDLVALALFGVVLRHCRSAQAVAALRQQEQQRIDSFAQDLKLLAKESTLD